MTDHTGPGETATTWRSPHPLPLVDEQRLLAANADAADYYRDQLLSPVATGPRGYLHERCLELVLNGESIWKVGYAPPGCPKYLNTPTTGLYRKVDTVLGLHEQRHLLAAGATPALVEGPFDVFAVNPGPPGRNSELAPVSVCGTALSTAHAAAIAAAAQPEVGIVIALDGDPAGREATRRSAATLKPISGPVRQAALAGEDPASLAQQHGTDHLRRQLPQARQQAVGHGSAPYP